MPVGHQGHCRVTMAVPIASGGFDQFFNLGLGQVLAAAELAVRLPSYYFAKGSYTGNAYASAGQSNKGRISPAYIG